LQVLCIATEENGEIVCEICGQHYKLYFERPSGADREQAVSVVMQALANHHREDHGHSAHPQRPFNVPEWSGAPEWSAAALLGGAPLRADPV
jgi:hypothetical protein